MSIYRTVLSYLMRKADPVYEYNLERERWKPSVVRHKPWDVPNYDYSGGRGNPPPPERVQEYGKKFEVTLDDQTMNSLEHYGQLGHQEINAHLRGEYSNIQAHNSNERHIGHIDRGMDRSPLPESVVVWRGVRSNHPVIDKLKDLGALGDELDYAKALGLRGFTFEEPGYLSTSFNQNMAKNFTDLGGVLFEIHVPVGTRAIYLPSSHTVWKTWQGSDITPFSGVKGETELLLDRGLTFRVTHVSTADRGFVGHGFFVKLDVIE